MMDVNWGNYAEAYRAIHEAITALLTSPPEGKRITKLEFAYDDDGNVDAIVFKQDDELLFTLTFGYDANKNVTSITRS